MRALTQASLAAGAARLQRFKITESEATAETNALGTDGLIRQQHSQPERSVKAVGLNLPPISLRARSSVVVTVLLSRHTLITCTPQ